MKFIRLFDLKISQLLTLSFFLLFNPKTMHARLWPLISILPSPFPFSGANDGWSVKSVSQTKSLDNKPVMHGVQTAIASEDYDFYSSRNYTKYG